jgi:hypothetical protein
MSGGQRDAESHVDHELGKPFRGAAATPVRDAAGAVWKVVSGNEPDRVDHPLPVSGL